MVVFFHLGLIGGMLNVKFDDRTKAEQKRKKNVKKLKPAVF